jgi:Glycosyl hydrolases family 25
MTLAIADVSEFQKTIDWAAYGAANPAAIVRVHNSNRPDNYAQPNIAGARAHCQWRGFYQYLTAGADPVKAAHDLQATLGPTQPGEVMILDLEEGAGDQSGRRAAWINALQDPVEWTYSGMYFARAHLPGVRVEWLAAYGQAEPTDAHTLWQNTNAQRFAGIATPCDASIFHGSLAQLQALSTPGLKPASSISTPTLTEDDMKPWFFRAKTGAIVIVTPTGVRAVDPATWRVWTNLGFGLAKGMDAMDPGPFAAILASLGGLVK